MASKTGNELYLDALIRHQIGLLRLSGSINNRIVQLLDATESDIKLRIERALADFVDTGGVDVARPSVAKKLKVLEESIAEIRTAATNDVLDEWINQMRDVAATEPAFMVAKVTASMPIVFDMALPAPALLRSLVTSQPFEGQTMKEWAKGMEEADLQRIMNEIRIGMVQGEGINDITRRVLGSSQFNGVDGVTQITRNEAMSITRTAVSFFSNAARQEFFDLNADIFEEELFVAVLDSRTTAVCFTGETPVQCLGELQDIFRAEYEGEIITITTSSGQKVEGTPNHPILTPHGFLPLGELKVGEHVVYSALPQSREILDNQKVAMPSTFAELFDAVNNPSISSVLRKSPTAADFYGDGVGMNNEIDICSTDSTLGDNLVSRFNESVKDELFRCIHRSGSFASKDCVDFLLRGGLPVAETSQINLIPAKNVPDPLTPAPTDQCGDLGRPHPLPIERDSLLDILVKVDIGFAALQNRHHTSPLEQSSDCGSGDLMPASKFCGRETAFVGEDDIVSVSREFRRCHVYTLSTSLGLYLAGGIVVKNCRANDGKRFAIGKGPKPPLHWNCRSLRVAVVTDKPIGNRPFNSATEKQLLREFGTENGLGALTSRDELPHGTKGSFDEFARGRTRQLIGRTPAATTYHQFLKRQSVEFQEEVLGKTKAKLFRKGDLTLDRFVNRNGNELTLHQLVLKERQAFIDAGLDPDDFL